MRLAIVLTFLLALVGSVLCRTQTRNIYEVYAIEFAGSKNRFAVNNVTLDTTATDSVSFSFYVWYLKGDNGRKVLVDAGFLQDTTSNQMPLKTYQRPDAALQRIHVNADDITDLVITHAHYDHIGGVDLFKKATVWMQKNEYSYFVGDAWQKDANHLGLNKQDVPKFVQLNLDGRLRLVSGDSVEIIPGIRVFTGSRHTYESQHLLVDTKTDKVLLASDDAWFYYNLQHLVSIPLTFNTDAYLRQLRRMKTQVSNPDLVIPGHDPLVLTKFTPVATGIVRIR